jgi:hypothetical protein
MMMMLKTKKVSPVSCLMEGKKKVKLISLSHY